MTGTRTRVTVATATAALLSGCLLAAGAGAGGGIYFTSQGVESVVPGGVEAVATATERAFEHFDLTRTELRVEPDNRVLRAEPSAGGDPQVTVTIRQEGEGTTRVEVKARTSVVTWDKEYARELIEKIVEYAH